SQSAAAFSTPANAFIGSRPPLNIYVFVGPRTDFCYSDHILAIMKLLRSERDRINRTGGIAGRRIAIQIRNDEGDAKRAIEIANEALADPETIALVGLQSSDRARGIFNQLGPRIKETGVPWLSGLVLTNIFEGYPNVFTSRGSQEDESLP